MEIRSDEYFIDAGSQQQMTHPAEAAEQKKMLTVIITGHAYSVLNVHEDEDPRLIELRNPWWQGE